MAGHDADPRRDDGTAAAASPLAQLGAIHAAVDVEVARLTALHAGRLQCRRGCSMCCVDGIEVAAVEADLIRDRHAELLRDGAPHPEGRCACLDGDGACRVYDSRPYVCRSQGLPLRWLDSDDDGFVELRDICPLNEAGPPVEDLPGDHCWSIGWVEASLAQLQGRLDGVDPLAFDDDDDDDFVDLDAGSGAGGARAVDDFGDVDAGSDARGARAVDDLSDVDAGSDARGVRVVDLGGSGGASAGDDAPAGGRHRPGGVRRVALRDLFARRG